MPLLKIEIARGNDRDYLLQMIETILDSMNHALKLPPDDRNVRLMEHDPGFFSMKPPYKMLVEITMFSGRSREAKKLLYRTIVDNLSAKLHIAKESVFIVINEQPLVNWGIQDGVPADEVDLGFKVNV